MEVWPWVPLAVRSRYTMSDIRIMDHHIQVNLAETRAMRRGMLFKDKEGSTCNGDTW